MKVLVKEEKIESTALVIQEVEVGSALIDILQAGDEIMTINGVDVSKNAAKFGHLLKGCCLRTY